MTTSSNPQSGASPVRPPVRPECVPDPHQGTGETGASPVPLSYGGDAPNEPSAGRTDQCVPTRVPSRVPSSPNLNLLEQLQIAVDRARRERRDRMESGQ